MGQRRYKDKFLIQAAKGKSWELGLLDSSSNERAVSYEGAPQGSCVMDDS